MPTKKKVREKPPQSADKDSRKPEAKPPVGKFAPIIEELGKMQSKIEGKSTDKQLSLQEKLMMEIESELLKKEETVRLNFGEIFRNDPQALVELISTMRRYGDAEILRDLLFAVETLYEHKVEDIPGGKEFWDNVRTEAAPPISRPLPPSGWSRCSARSPPRFTRPGPRATRSCGPASPAAHA